MMRGFKKCCIMMLFALLLGGCGKAPSAQADIQQNAPGEVANTASLAGKILLSSIRQDADTMTFEIYALGLQTGASYELVRRFVVPNAESAVFYNDAAYPSVNKFFDFTADYTKLAATRQVDGVAHAGWVDGAGNFTDATAGKAGEFFAFGFTNKGRFVYHDAGDQYYSVNVMDLTDCQNYSYNVADFIAKNQTFVDMRLGDEYTCWAKVASPDGRKMVFCAMQGGDANTRQLYLASTIGINAEAWRAMPATNTILELTATEKYGAVYGDGVIDWR